MVLTTISNIHRWAAAAKRFGRNVPLDQTFPDTANLMTPSPRVVSRDLMTRREFQPATILNLMAASWIQFMVHDWFVHKRSETSFVEIPLAQGDDWSDSALKVPRSIPEPAPAGSKRPPAYANPTDTGGMGRRSMDPIQRSPPS
jgi:hypothetical protein